LTRSWTILSILRMTSFLPFCVTIAIISLSLKLCCFVNCNYQLQKYIGFLSKDKRPRKN
jgi:hypothetical protein